MLALTIGLAALVLALVEGNAWHWGSARVRPVRDAAIAWEPSSSSATAVPMVDFDFFRSRTFLGANIVAFIVSFAMLAMFFFMALYMQNILDYRRFRPACASCRRR